MKVKHTAAAEAEAELRIRDRQAALAREQVGEAVHALVGSLAEEANPKLLARRGASWAGVRARRMAADAVRRGTVAGRRAADRAADRLKHVPASWRGHRQPPGWKWADPARLIEVEPARLIAFGVAGAAVALVTWRALDHRRDQHDGGTGSAVTTGAFGSGSATGRRRNALMAGGRRAGR